jgi:tetratricopeptide (TPR) repeat protein
MTENCTHALVGKVTEIRADFEQWDNSVDNHTSDKEQLYEIIKSINAKALCRLAVCELVLSYASIKVNDDKNEKQYVLEALQHTKMALELDPNSFECMKWFCASAGKATHLVSSNERIRLGILIKVCSDKAFALEPNDSMLYFITGRWCYEISGLSAVERNYASVFFNTTLKSSYSDALVALKRADELKPKWKINYLWIAKVLIAQKNYCEASVKIKEALSFENLTEEDFVAHKELTELQNQHKKQLQIK